MNKWLVMFAFGEETSTHTIEAGTIEEVIEHAHIHAELPFDWIIVFVLCVDFITAVNFDH